MPVPEIKPIIIGSTSVQLRFVSAAPPTRDTFTQYSTLVHSIFSRMHLSICFSKIPLESSYVSSPISLEIVMDAFRNCNHHT